MLVEKKIICDQTDKNSYIVHYRNLKFYVKMGRIIEKIHKVISFKQVLVEEVFSRRTTVQKGDLKLKRILECFFIKV